RASAARTRCSISSGVAGQRNHSSALSSTARRRTVSSAQATITGTPHPWARSTTSRRMVGSVVATSTARTAGREATALANSPARRRSTSQPSRCCMAGASDGRSESVSRMELLTAPSRCRSRRQSALHREVALNRRRQRWQLERLFHVVVGSELKRLAFVLPFVECRDHHDAYAPAKRRMLLHDATHLPAVAAVRHRDPVSARFQLLADDLGVVVIVVNHQNRWRLCILHDTAWFASLERGARLARAPSEFGKSQAIYRCPNAYESPTPYNIPPGPPTARAREPPMSTPAVTPNDGVTPKSAPKPERKSPPDFAPPVKNTKAGDANTDRPWLAPSACRHPIAAPTGISAVLTAESGDALRLPLPPPIPAKAANPNVLEAPPNGIAARTPYTLRDLRPVRL